MANFKLNLKPFNRLLRSLLGEPVPDEVRKQWSVRYSAFVRRNFVSGNNWKPLKSSTLKRRRGKGKGAKPLRDTGVLLNALSVGAKGNFNEQIKNGVRFGFDDVPHPGSSKTIRAIAIIHDEGKGNIPKREILIAPDNKLIKSMGQDLKRSIEKRGKRFGRI